MISFLGYFFLLLIPILLILIVRLRRRRRVVYSHTFLRSFEEKRLLDYLLRNFRIYHDVLFDLILAVILALFLAQVIRFTPDRTAVCIDGSYSMLREDADGRTALERAVLLATAGETSREKQRIFLLAWDKRRGTTGVFRLEEPELAPGIDAAARRRIIAAYADRLRASHTFLNADPAALQDLFDRGYRQVMFITDRFTADSTNLQVTEVGSGERSFFYPASVYYDFSAAGFRVLLQRFNYEKPIAVQRYLEQRGGYVVIQASEQSIPGSDLSLLEIREEGLYRILGPGLDYIYDLKVPRRPVTASGPYSRIIADVLPQIEVGESNILIADLALQVESQRVPAGQIRALGRQKHRYITLIPDGNVRTLPLLYPLERSFSQPAYAELPARLGKLPQRLGESTRLFFQNPGRTRDDQTPLVYLSYLESDHPVEFSRDGPPGSRDWKEAEDRSGLTSLVYVRGSDILPVNLSAREFFPIAPRGDLVFQRRTVNPLPCVLILLLVYLAKIVFLMVFRAGGSKKQTRSRNAEPAAPVWSRRRFQR
ncbi:MAG: hypothetical protein JXB06_08515 [Spirochaetales bacterium]|nr:hypothetical protein [Spirochaetales bacterium]